MALPNLFRWGRGSEVPVLRTHEINPIIVLYSEMNRLFDEIWRSFGNFRTAWPREGWSGFQPRVDVDETGAAFRVTVELPGMEEKGFELQLEPDVLVIRGEKREERSTERSELAQDERRCAAFERRGRLPCEVEANRVSAEYKHGLLRVTLPKSEEARRRAIAIPVKAG
jgi:HSP20 family protein